MTTLIRRWHPGDPIPEGMVTLDGPLTRRIAERRADDLTPVVDRRSGWVRRAMDGELPADIKKGRAA